MILTIYLPCTLNYYLRLQCVCYECEFVHIDPAHEVCPTPLTVPPRLGLSESVFPLPLPTSNHKILRILPGSEPGLPAPICFCVSLPGEPCCSCAQWHIMLFPPPHCCNCNIDMYFSKNLTTTEIRKPINGSIAIKHRNHR